MTSWVTIKFLDWFDIDPKKVRINVLTACTTPALGGTSAQLLAGEKMTIYELMYAMMLPSGNDAAMTLAENFGQRVMGTKRPGEIRKPSVCIKPTENKDKND